MEKEYKEYIENFKSNGAIYIAVCKKRGNVVTAKLYRGKKQDYHIIVRSYKNKSLSLCANAIWTDFKNEVKKQMAQNAFDQQNQQNHAQDVF